jgi:hypothetical protein
MLLLCAQISNMKVLADHSYVFFWLQQRKECKQRIDSKKYVLCLLCPKKTSVCDMSIGARMMVLDGNALPVK